MAYHLRSGRKHTFSGSSVSSRPSSAASLPYTSGYQSSADQSSELTSRMHDITSTLDEIRKMVDSLTATSEFERGIKSVVSLLVSQVKEVKFEHHKLEQGVLFNHKQVTDNIDELALSVVKSEQYTRRDTLTVVGLPMPGPESQSDLCTKVADVLSASGESVSVADISAAHRNSKNSKEIKGKTVPPSVTVKLSKVNKKDNVLRGYKNYDSSTKQPRQVKVYQSLSGHYSEVRRRIFEFFNASRDDLSFGPIINPGMKVKWVTYQSPSSGFAIKLESGDYFKGVHMWHQFVDIMYEKYADCRVS